MLRSEIVPERGARVEVVVRPLFAPDSLRDAAERLVVLRALGVERLVVAVPLLRASREVPGCAGVIVGTPLEVVRVGVERGSEELEVPPLDERLVLGRLAGVEELRGVEPDEREMPPEELLLPLEREMPPEERLLLPLEREIPPEERLLLPLERLIPPDDPLLPPLERLTPPEDRLLAPLERLTPPEDRLLPPLERLTPPDERELPDDPALDVRCASTRFTGAANRTTASAANKKKLIRLGVSISDLRLLTRGNEKSPAGRLLCL